METTSKFTIGLDTTSFSRWLRLVFGIGMILSAGSLAVQKDSGTLLATLAYFVAIVVIYFAAYLLLGERILAKMSPWVGTLLLVVPAVVIAVVPIFPIPLQLAMTLYIGISFLANFYLSYGGCEVLGLQTLVFGYRYNVYCPTNVIDAAEKVIVESRGKSLTPLSATRNNLIEEQ